MSFHCSECEIIGIMDSRHRGWNFGFVRQPDNAAEEKCDQPQARQPNFYDFSTKVEPMNLGKASWWFQRFFIFTPNLGEMIQLDEHRDTLLGTITYPWKIINSKVPLQGDMLLPWRGSHKPRIVVLVLRILLCLCHVTQTSFQVTHVVSFP